jgi:hypothetical protein
VPAFLFDAAGYDAQAIPTEHKPYAVARTMANLLALMTEGAFRAMMPAADSRTMPRLFTSRR